MSWRATIVWLDQPHVRDDQLDRSRVGESLFANRKVDKSLAAAAHEFTLQNRGGMAALVKAVRIESETAAGHGPAVRFAGHRTLCINNVLSKQFSVEFACDWRTIRCLKASCFYHTIYTDLGRFF